MLVLTRKVGERLVIGDNIVVTIVDIRSDSVRLAIDAPKAVKIYRSEIYDAIVAENRAAASPLGMESLDALKEFHKISGK